MTKKSELILPALRGVMGDWVFYSCLMSIEDLGSRVSFADEIHKSKELSGMIQRQLKRGRSDQIASYLRSQEERFFNSLVLATYGGAPNWSALDDLKSESRTDFVGKLDEETVSSVGFLTLTGGESLFAVDGQHRLAGIKKAMRAGLGQDPLDDISVIFVAHRQTEKGFQRTRRLFTTLNKTAKPVSKGDIIALDEDDVMAITVRRLIEESDYFGEEGIAFVASNNMPATNFTGLTTIGNLYDILTTLFTGFDTELKSKKMDLQFQRPPEEKLEEYYKLATTYFRFLGESFPALQEFFDAKATENVVKKHRGNHGGDAFYRPLGLAIFSGIIAKLSKEHELEDAIELASCLPTKLSGAPYTGLMWDPSGKRIVGSNSVTLREVLLHMIGEAKFKESTILERYRKALGQEDAELPDRVI